MSGTTPFRHSETFWRLFDLGFGLWRRTRLAPTRGAGLPHALPADRPLVLVANHVSWWDGFLLREVQRTLRPGASFHTVVLARQLQRHPILRRLGGVEVDPGYTGSTRALIRGLRATRSTKPDLVLSCFPEGRIGPVTRRPLGFHRGIESMVSALAPAVVLPVALRIEPLVQVRPIPFLWMGEPILADRSGEIAVDRIEEAVTDGLERMETVLNRHRESVLEVWAPGLRPDRPALDHESEGALAATSVPNR